MDKRLYTKFVFNRLKRHCPEWPLSNSLTKAFIEDISSNYNILERNVDLIKCNVSYNGVIIKKRIFIEAVTILKAELKREKTAFGKVIEI